MNHLPKVGVTLLLLLHSTSPSVISSTRNRLPMSLSTIISDLEAEGVTQLCTATFLASQSVTSSQRSAIFKSLFEEDDEEGSEETGGGNDDESTAFGKKLGEDDEEGVGIVAANPCAVGVPSGAGVVASTVLATHGTVIYICSPVDLKRGEGLFEHLAPAVERLRALRSNENVHYAGELIVIFWGGEEEKEMMKSQFERHAATMLRGIVTPRGAPVAERLEDVFDTVEYLTSDGIAAGEEFHILTNTLLEGEGQLLQPADAAAAVAAAVGMGMMDGSAAEGGDLSPIDLAALRKIHTARDEAVAEVRATIARASGEEEDGADEDDITLVPNFGALCHAAIGQALTKFDESVGPTLLSQSALARRKRAAVKGDIIIALAPSHERQLNVLKKASFEGFRKDLSKLRVGPNLPQDMDAVVSTSVASFAKSAKKLSLPGGAASGLWCSPSATQCGYRKELKDFCAERLRAARVSGAFRPLPRKGVTVGLHWLLPKPFGNDYRQVASEIYRGDLVYTPKGKMTEVPKESVQSGDGDWRRLIVPVPGATDMMYQSGTQ